MVSPKVQSLTPYFSVSTVYVAISLLFVWKHVFPCVNPRDNLVNCISENYKKKSLAHTFLQSNTDKTWIVVLVELVDYSP